MIGEWEDKHYFTLYETAGFGILAKDSARQVERSKLEEGTRGKEIH